MVVFFLVLLWAGIAHAHPLDDMKPGTWLSLYNTPPLQGVLHPDNVKRNSVNAVLEESGGVYDSDAQCLVIWGGGHDSTWDNAFYRWCLSTMKFERFNEPVLYTRRDENNVLTGTGYYPDAQGKPDKQQPRSRHSGAAITYVPPIKRMCSFVAGALYRDGNGGFMDVTGPDGKRIEPRRIGLVDCHSFIERNWIQYPPIVYSNLLSNYLVITVYDSVKQRVLIHASGSTLLAWYPSDGRQETLSQAYTYPRGPNTGGHNKNGLYDRKRQRFVAMGDGGIAFVDVSGATQLPAWQNVTAQVNGPEAKAIIARRPGFEYDTRRDRYTFWGGDDHAHYVLPPSCVYDIHPDTWEVTKQCSTQGAPAVPFEQCPKCGSLGTWGRWRYIEEYGVFALANNKLNHFMRFWKPRDTAAVVLDGSGKVGVR